MPRLDERPAPSCILLLSDHAYIGDAAESYVRHICRAARSQKELHPDVLGAVREGPVDFVLNLLSPVILPSAVLSSARVAAVNFHPAPPKCPGVGSASFALYDGDAEFGVTAHLMAERVDSGAILKVLRFPILNGDDCHSLWQRALHYSLVLFYDVARELARDRSAVPSGETWERPPVTRKQFERWMTLPADATDEEIRRKVRALRHPHFPGPFLEVEGMRLSVRPADAA
jgi:methionyl-tRNA formyltransferase